MLSNPTKSPSSYGVVRLQDIDSPEFRGLLPSHRCVYFTLLPFLNHQREAWPKVDRLARITGLSTRTVLRALRSMEDAGIIGVSKRHLSAARRTNLYVMPEPSFA